MVITLDLSAAEEDLLRQEAERQGTDPEGLLRRLIGHLLSAAPPAQAGSLAAAPADVWAREFRRWVGSHDPSTPVPPPEAYSRENLYEDRV